MQSTKETGSNIAASAKAGMEKTKAALQEKGEKMTSHDPLQKEMATEKKELKIQEAERQKQLAKEHNAAAKHTTEAGMAPPHSDTKAESVLHPQGVGRRAGH